MISLLLVVWASVAGAQELPPPAAELLAQARRANPVRYDYAVARGAEILPTVDGRSFFMRWRPEDARGWIVTLHGSGSWAFDEFFLWHAQAAEFGFGVVALQWWYGNGDGVDSYASPEAIHRQLADALRRAEVEEGTALLHGFSRGSANIYAVAAQDRPAGNRFYTMVLANAGGAAADFPPNLAIARGEFGWNAFSGQQWAMFCGGRDPNPERDGCPAMRRTAAWVDRFGGFVEPTIEDADAGHGGFHQNAAHIRTVLEAFKARLEAGRGAVSPGAEWRVEPDTDFRLEGSGVPNVGRVNGEVWLTAAARLFRSADGRRFGPAEPLPGLAAALTGTGFTATEIVPRAGPVLFVLGLAPPGTNRALLYRLKQNAEGMFVRDPAEPAYSGAEEDHEFLGVPDVTAAADGRLRLMYVARGTARSNARTAVSADGGATFTQEFDNPFGDLAEASPNAGNTNVDPAVLRLSRGGYLAVTMRDMRLYLFTSDDGRSFVPANAPPVAASQFGPGLRGLFDPTLIELADGIWMYATADDRIVRARLVTAGY